ncbi:DUF6332 family protein [Streptomyces sp. SMC 277]|uniref:DUF6332 family protein n=1 Tax=Streptomyces antimicrobicus TaxID=2883108 RepID=A0ABS8B6E0_9ACTN|nr:DUF6332 family protein [Streptomyces antimicrobicus]
MTIEIGYALFSGMFAAALVYGAVAGPALLFALPHRVEQALVLGGSVLAATVFALRATHLLWRFLRRPSDDGGL